MLPCFSHAQAMMRICFSLNSYNQIIQYKQDKKNHKLGEMVNYGADGGHKLTDAKLRTARSSVEAEGKPLKLPFQITSQDISTGSAGKTFVCSVA